MKKNFTFADIKNDNGNRKAVGGKVPRSAAGLKFCDGSHGGAVPAEHIDSRNRKAVGGRVPRSARAFTLAEVLITLGVVGIVAVLTIPAVVKNYRNRMYVAQFQKVQAQLADAVQSVMNDEHTDKFYETKAGTANSCSNANNGVCEKGIGYLLNNYMKTVKKNCLDSTEPCATATGSTYSMVDGTKLTAGFSPAEYCIQTTNGATVCGWYNPANSCMSVAVDVNAMAEPNTAGRDIFSMDIHNDGTISDYGSGCVAGNFGTASANCTKGTKAQVYNAASGCYSKLLKSGWKMDY